MKLVQAQAGDILAAQLYVVEVDDEGLSAQVYGVMDVGPSWYASEEVDRMSFVRHERLTPPAPAAPPAPLAFAIGDRVMRHWNHRDIGLVRAIDQDRYWVRFGAVSTTLLAQDLVLA